MIPGIFGNCKSVPFPLPPACLPALLIAVIVQHRRRRGGPARPPPACRTAPRVVLHLLHRPLPSRWLSPLLATRLEPPAAATSTPPWRAQDRARRSLLSRAAALQVPQLANAFVLLLFPHSDASERLRRPYPRRRAHRRRRPTIPEPLHPYRLRQKLCLIPTKLIDRFSSPRTLRSHPAAVLRAPTAAARR